MVMLQDTVKRIRFKMFEHQQIKTNQISFSCQDAVECYMLRGDFIRDLRDDDHKQFFDLTDVEACSAKAIEQNFSFVLEVVATLAPEKVWMAHAGWKAGIYQNIPRQETR